MRSKKLDQIDIRILAALQRDGRITNQRLSTMVGLSPRPCLERIRKLERAGYISRYMAVLNPALVTGLIIVFAEIALKDQSRTTQEAFERRLAATPEVVECYLVSGQFDYIARIASPGLDRYRDLTATWIDDAGLGVARIVSSIVLQPVRDFSGYPIAAESAV